MLDDFVPIIHKFNDKIKIIPLADMHVGNVDFAEDKWRSFKKWLLEQKDTYLVIAGDILDNTIKSSVGNCFQNIMQPQEQKEWLARELQEIKHLILCGTSGNHEDRSLKECDSNPLYDVFCRLGIESLYRPNACFMKIQIGERNEHERTTYTICVSHGINNKSKTEKFNLNIEGIDIFITGHTHKPSIEPSNSKLVFDTKNNTISFKPIYTIVTTSWLNYGGYALKGKYLPISHAIQTIVLNKKHNKSIDIEVKGGE